MNILLKYLLLGKKRIIIDKSSKAATITFACQQNGRMWFFGFLKKLFFKNSPVPIIRLCSYFFTPPCIFRHFFLTITPRAFQNFSHAKKDLDVEKAFGCNNTCQSMVGYILSLRLFSFSARFELPPDMRHINGRIFGQNLQNDDGHGAQQRGQRDPHARVVLLFLLRPRPALSSASAAAEEKSCDGHDDCEDKSYCDDGDDPRVVLDQLRPVLSDISEPDISAVDLDQTCEEKRKRRHQIVLKASEKENENSC